MSDSAEAQVRRVLDALAIRGVKPQRLCADSRQVLAGDVFYSRAMAARVLPFLRRAAGQGSLVLVGDPGRAYPRQTLTHTYTTPGDRTVTLTKTWSGEYSIAGLPYRPVEGTATTVSPGVGVHVLAGRNVLTAPDD